MLICADRARLECTDKPVLISPLAAKCDVLLTRDKGDFGWLPGTTVYGMQVSTPRDFLIQAGLG